MKKLLTIGALALTGCAGHLDYTVEPIKPIPITGTIPEKEKTFEKVAKPWAQPCEKVEMKPGKYRAVVRGEEMVYEVVIFGKEMKKCKLHLSIEEKETFRDKGCDSTIDELFSLDFSPRIPGGSLEEWGLAEMFDSMLEEGSGYACAENKIKSKAQKSAEEIESRYGSKK